VDESPRDERDVERELRSQVALDDGAALEPEWPPPGRRPLRRRAHERWVAGVAGGLADRWGVRALAVRIPLAIAAFVSASTAWQVLTGGNVVDASDGIMPLIVGGSFLAIVVYLVLWVVVPREDVVRSPVGRVGARLDPRRLTERYPGIRSIPGFVAIAVGGAILADRLGIWEPDLALAAGLIALGIWLYRRDRAAPSDVRVIEPENEATRSETSTMPRSAPYPLQASPPRERSPLGWITFGVALLVVCIAAIWSRLAGDTSSSMREVGDALFVLERASGLGRVSAIPALGLLVLAAGLLIGSVFGRARWLIAPAILLVPVVLVTSVIRLPVDGAVGDTYVRVGVPGSSSENETVVRRRAVGSIHVDLNRLRGASGVTRALELSTVAGAVTVVVPFDAHVEVDAFTGLGTLALGRRSEYGVELAETASLEPRHGNGATLIVSAEVGLGNVHILRYAPTKRQLQRLREQERRERPGGRETAA
jgi:phage shock protein PspC (stress-responsive transcriptional regulator)